MNEIEPTMSRCVYKIICKFGSVFILFITSILHLKLIDNNLNAYIQFDIFERQTVKNMCIIVIGDNNYLSYTSKLNKILYLQLIGKELKMIYIYLPPLHY